MTRRNLTPLDAAVVDLAERQHGVLRRADLLALGMTPDQLRHRVRSRRLHPLHPGVYALGHRVLSRDARLLAAVWWCGAGAALSHESAATFYGWMALDALAPVHVTTTRNRDSRPGVAVHRTRHLDHRHVVAYGLLRVTDRVRTLVDLADHLTDAELRRVADELPELPAARLAAVATQLAGRHGAGRIKRLLDAEVVRTKSELERRFTRYCAAHGLPRPPRRNVWVASHKADCHYPAERLVVELDGRTHHQRRAQMAEDRRRDADYQLAGERILRLLWEDTALDAPRAAAVLRRLLAVRP